MVQIVYTKRNAQMDLLMKEKSSCLLSPWLCLQTIVAQCTQGGESETEIPHAASVLRSWLCACAVKSKSQSSSSAGVDGPAANVSVCGESETEAEAMITESRLDILFEPGGPVPVLLKLAVEEARLEEDKGTEARSPLLQALVQVCSNAR